MRVRARGLVVFVLLALGLTCVASTASAKGALIGPADLSPPARAALLADIAKARRNDPQTFSWLQDLRWQVALPDAKKAGRYAAIGATLAGWGQRALMPMLQELAVDSLPRGKLTATAWRAWRVGLLEAVGSLRDPRSAAVLSAILDSYISEHQVIRAAAEALGRLSTDEAAAKLISLSQQGGIKQLPVLAGMGHCRRVVVAQRLSEAIASAPDWRTAKIVARSLGDVGSAWAWQTPVDSSSGEELATRGVAAAGLVSAFVAFSYEDVRQALTRAILVVDDPSTPDLIAAAKEGAPAGLAAALDELQARFDRSPLP